MTLEGSGSTRLREDAWKKPESLSVLIINNIIVIRLFIRFLIIPAHRLQRTGVCIPHRIPCARE